MMACSGAYATAADFENFFVCGELSDDEAAGWEITFALTASNIHAVLAQTAACDCNLASWAGPYLAKLNIIEAILMRQCGCGAVPLTEEDKTAYREMLKNEYERILTGQIDVCDGGTGINYPASDIIQQALTPWSAGQIVLNRIRK